MLPSPALNFPCTLPASVDGQRLDAALATVLPSLGKRARKRLCDEGRITLNGRNARAADKVRAGWFIDLLALESPASSTANTLCGACLKDTPPHVVTANNHLVALFKPAGLHSAHITATTAPSLEAALPKIFSGFPQSPPQLLNRLDQYTSGLVLAAFSQIGIKLWQDAENTGTVDKRYLAVIEGVLQAPQTLVAPLDTQKRKTTRVCHGTAEPLRHTVVTPLSVCQPSHACAFTLVGCRIRKGARHQIRAHLAASGHALVGDTQYGAQPAVWSKVCASPLPPFLLHHAHVRVDAFSATHMPTWLPWLFVDAVCAAQTWLAED